MAEAVLESNPHEFSQEQLDVSGNAYNGGINSQAAMAEYEG